MKKKIVKRNYLGLNVEQARKIGYPEEMIRELVLELNSKRISPKFYYRTNIPPELLVLHGSFEEKAYLKSNLHEKTYQRGNLHKNKKYKLKTDCPLNFTARQKRNWERIASRFFKPLIEKELELLTEKESNFKTILKRPYVEQEIKICDPETGQIIKVNTIRIRKYSDKSLYGSNSTLPEFFRKRNAWLKIEYRKLHKNGKPEMDCYPELKENLFNLPTHYFGKKCQPKNRTPFQLEVETIKFIVQSKKS